MSGEGSGVYAGVAGVSQSAAVSSSTRGEVPTLFVCQVEEAGGGASLTGKVDCVSAGGCRRMSKR